MPAICVPLDKNYNSDRNFAADGFWRPPNKGYDCMCCINHHNHTGLMSHVSSNASDEDHSIKPDDDFIHEAAGLNYQQQKEKRRQDYVPQEVTVSQLFHLQSVCCFIVI